MVSWVRQCSVAAKLQVYKETSVTYTIAEIAQAAGVSKRTVYSYAERRLIPPPLRQGRNLMYTEEHLEALRLVRVLLRLGLPIRQVEQLVVGREHGEVRRALAPVLPLAKLLHEVEARVAELQRKVRAPVSDELDLRELGLDDPVRLRHELAEAERQRVRLQSEFDHAGAAVLRELLGPITPPAEAESDATFSNGIDEAPDLRRYLGSMATELRDRLTRMESMLEEALLEAKREAFRAGLVAARACGWCPDPTAAPPDTLGSEFAQVFHTFVGDTSAAHAVVTTVADRHKTPGRAASR